MLDILQALTEAARLMAALLALKGSASTRQSED